MFGRTWALLERQSQVLPMAAGYTICSSMLMVVNKLALKVFPFPSTLMALQFFTSAAVVRFLAFQGKLDAAPLEAEKERRECINNSYIVYSVQHERSAEGAPHPCPSRSRARWAP